jgi:hypothetical protein
MNIIDNYRKLSIGKYLQIVDLCNTEMDEIDRKVRIVGILTGLTDDEVLSLPLPEFTECCAKAQFLDKQCPENLIPSVSKSYPVGGFVLVPVTDMRKVTAAQYIDFQTFSKDREKYIVEMLSCFLIPKGCEYNDGYDILDVHNAIKEEMSVAEVLAVLAFFFKSWTLSLRNTLTYSERMAGKVKDKTKRKKVMEAIAEIRSGMFGDGSQR